VRAGVSKKGQAEGLTFFADRPRTRISLSIAQRGLTGNFIEIGIAEHRAAGVAGQFIEIGIAGAPLDRGGKLRDYSINQWFHDAIVLLIVLRYRKKILEVSNMKQKKCSVFLALLVLTITGFIAGCASGPELGEETDLQRALNQLPAVPVAGKDLKFQFGGDAWISRVDGKEFLAGTFKSEDNDSGSVLTLTQTHLYSDQQKPGVGGDVGWVKTPGPAIVLQYTEGPPPALSAE
jgi:hypothetical protein